MIYYIYCITNVINHRTYIGQHKTKNINDGYMGSGILLHKAFEKYGLENFTKSILAITGTKENINILEKHFIALYKSEGKAEYNISDGGFGGYLGEEWKELVIKGMEGAYTPEVREKMRNSHLGQIPYNKGKKGIYSDETRKLMGVKNKGRVWYTDGVKSVLSFSCPEGFHRGRTILNETKIKISKKNKGRKWNESQKQNLSLLMKSKNKGEHKGMTWKVINGKRVWLNVEDK